MRSAPPAPERTGWGGLMCGGQPLPVRLLAASFSSHLERAQRFRLLILGWGDCDTTTEWPEALNCGSSRLRPGRADRVSQLSGDTLWFQMSIPAKHSQIAVSTDEGNLGHAQSILKEARHGLVT